nr:MAG: hypothetical protein [Molluscum contagiosum virus]
MMTRSCPSRTRGLSSSTSTVAWKAVPRFWTCPTRASCTCASAPSSAAIT